MLPSPSMPLVLPPTHDDLANASCRPYFLWWADTTAGELRTHLHSTDAEERAYWTGALPREANTRDVWLFVTPTRCAPSGLDCSATSVGRPGSGPICSGSRSASGSSPFPDPPREG